MSRNGTLLPIPEGSAIAEYVQEAIDEWPTAGYQRQLFPRSFWLGAVEGMLLAFYPQSSSADRRLTARHAAPFPLRDGPNVP